MEEAARAGQCSCTGGTPGRSCSCWPGAPEPPESIRKRTEEPEAPFWCFLVFFEQRYPNTPHFFPKQLLMEAPIQLLSACSPCRMEFARTGITQEKEGLQVTESAGRAARMRRALPQPAALCRHGQMSALSPDTQAGDGSCCSLLSQQLPQGPQRLCSVISLFLWFHFSFSTAVTLYLYTSNIILQWHGVFKQ